MSDPAASGSGNSSFQSMTDAQLIQTINQLTNTTGKPQAQPAAPQVHPGMSSIMLQNTPFALILQQHTSTTSGGGRTRSPLLPRMDGRIQVERDGQSRAARSRLCRLRLQARPRITLRPHLACNHLHRCRRLLPHRLTTHLAYTSPARRRPCTPPMHRACARGPRCSCSPSSPARRAPL